MAQQHVRGKLGAGRHNAPRAIKRAKQMEKGLSVNAALFPNPNPTLAVFSNQIEVSDQAQVTAEQGGKGMTAARDVQLGLLVGMMSSELVYIQSVADAGNPDEAVQTLLAGGVEIALVGSHTKAVLKAMAGGQTGSVVLEANATNLLGALIHRKHFFNWEYTTDGKTFTTLPSTPEAKTLVIGLPPLTTVGFRVSATTSKNNATAWSAIVNFLVL